MRGGGAAASAAAPVVSCAPASSAATASGEPRTHGLCALGPGCRLHRRVRRSPLCPPRYVLKGRPMAARRGRESWQRRAAAGPCAARHVQRAARGLRGGPRSRQRWGAGERAAAGRKRGRALPPCWRRRRGRFVRVFSGVPHRCSSALWAPARPRSARAAARGLLYPVAHCPGASDGRAGQRSRQTRHARD